MDWRYNTIWFEQIAPGKQITWDFKDQKKLPLNLTDKEYATLWYYREKGTSLGHIPPSEELLYLELNWANIKAFTQIERFSNLKRLEVHYCTKLESDGGLALLKETIEHLHINQSKKLQLTGEISHLKKLKVLCLNACGPLENINFLKDLPNLIDFRFVDTNVLDGDLTPILDHPNLKSAAFFNKRHYNITCDKIDTELESRVRTKSDYIDFVYKGPYKTFKYK